MPLKKAIREMKNNDQIVFDELFERYHRKIYFFCLHSGLSPADSEEIVQEVFIKIWHGRKNLDPSKNVKAYLYKIAKNAMLDEFKRRIKQKAAEDYQVRLWLPENHTQNSVDYNELEELVAETLKGLPEKRRLVFELSRYKGLSNKEIAKEMDITVKTVESHLTHALKNFKAVFKKAEIIASLLGIFIFRTISSFF
ncbi:RNA polymerase sigma-70 factor [Fulvivirgaceae bacterium BMA12]|uniref:RNA polymerase sigma factor n=1 Tax=Agaribacillus aureus TaxID=3051825 RepID=A0ABT8KZC2_9BACT|nr:RNA polymerase sigma-70 factor [Fulvivirgaceae bacterium BMA12]